MNMSLIRIVSRDENSKAIGVENLEMDLKLNAIER